MLLNNVTTQKLRAVFGIGMKKDNRSIAEFASMCKEVNVLMKNEEEFSPAAPKKEIPKAPQSPRSYLNDLYMHTSYKVQKDR